MQLLTQAGHARNQTMHAEESLAALEQDAERLASEISAASSELARWVRNADRLRLNSNQSLNNYNASRAN